MIQSTRITSRLASLGRSLTIALAALAAGGGQMAAAQAAEDWPTKAVELIVPVAAGGGLDLHARLLADQLSEQLGQPVVVVNRPGAAGAIGAESVVNASPDGYTMLLQSVSTAVTLIYSNPDLNYSPTEDLTPVSLIARFPLVMTLNKDLPADTLEDFIQLLKDNPGKYSYGHSGFGSTLELVGEFFKSQAGVDITGIPYKGTGPILPDLLAGRVAMMLNGLPPEFERIKNGDVKAIAVTSAERSPAAPDIPTLKETFPNFDMPFWIGIYVKSGTPEGIVQKMSAEIAKAIQTDSVKTRLQEIGSEPVGSTPEEFDAFWKQQLDLYGKIVAGMKKQG